MKKILYLLLLITALSFGQTPNISYNNVQTTYFVDSSILSLSPNNIGGVPTYRTTVSTISGTQNAVFVDGPVGSYSYPIVTGVNSNGIVYVIDDFYPCIRQIMPDGTTSTLAGKHIIDGSGSIQLGYVDGQGSDAEFNTPRAMAIDANNNIFVSDTFNHVIRKVTPTGLVTTYATGLNYPYGLCIDNNGNIYVVDLQSNPATAINAAAVIRKIDTNGVISVIAGSQFLSGNLDGQGTLARFNHAKGIAIDSNGNLYVSDSKNNKIRKITPSGLVTTYATGFNYPIGITIDSNNNLYVCDSGYNIISQVDTSGSVIQYAGSGVSAYNDSDALINGLGNVARFNNPNGVAIDSSKNLYIADRNTQRIRKISLLTPYTITPSLPAGLSFNVETGVITGTPTETRPSTTYTITAANYVGVSTTTITFSVNTLPSCSSFTVWNGTSWSAGIPNSTINAKINGNLTITSSNSFSTCNLIVNGNLIIEDGGSIDVENHIIVNSVGNFLVKSGGKLIPKSNTSLCFGNVTVQRTTPSLKKYDYTYWSSPVSNSLISSALLPTNWLLNHTFTFNTNNFYDVQTQIGSTITAGSDGQDDDGNAWVLVSPNDIFTPCKGYASMVSTNGGFPRTETVSFTGKINTGTIQTPLLLSANPSATNDDFNLVGNPYSSSISANDFIITNLSNISGVLYFWTHAGSLSSNYPGLSLLNFSEMDYAYYNLSGGVASSFGGRIPTQYIGTGQGFCVEAQNNNNLIFKPTFMSNVYSNTTNSSFFRTANTHNKVWLSISTDLGLFSQQLISYDSDTSLDYDNGYDLEQPDNRLACKFYSIENDIKYKIQSRGKFDTSDVIKLGYFTAVPETYTITLDSIAGIDNVYIKDNGVLHELPYTFTSEDGEFNDRFELVYTNNDLGVNNPTKNNIKVYPNPTNDLLYIENYDGDFKIFDLLGREYDVKHEVINNKIVVSLGDISKGTYILKLDKLSFKIIKK